MKLFKTLLLTITTIVACTAITYAYSDVTPDNQYYEAIQYVTENHISNGVGNDKFAPDRDITVAQFCTMLIRTFDYDIAHSEQPCTYEIVRICSEYDWVSDEYIQYDRNVHKPISKGSAALGIISALDVHIYDNRLYGGERLSYYHEATNVAKYNGIYDEDAEYYDTITRAEAANLIYRFVTNGVQQEIPQIMQEFEIIDNEYVDTDPYYIEIMKCPEEIRDQFVEDGWKFIIDDDPIEEFSRETGIKSVIGLTSYDDRRIAISSITADAIIHEFGHYLRHRIGRAYDVQKLYNEEGITNSAFREYARSSYEEYFAEFFDYYVTDSWGMLEFAKITSPKTYMFFEQLQSNGWV